MHDVKRFTSKIETTLQGSIIDSWVENCKIGNSRRLIVQVAPRGRPDELWIVEASATLVSDRGWLEDLSENLCHGSLIAAVGQLGVSGFFLASQLQLIR